MSITQKAIKEQIASTEKLVEEVVREKRELLDELREIGDKSNNINLQSNEKYMDKVDEHTGLLQTIQYYTGHLNALNWVLKEMRGKN